MTPRQVAGHIPPVAWVAVVAILAWYYLGRTPSNAQPYPLSDEDIRSMPGAWSVAHVAIPSWLGRTSWNVKDHRGTLGRWAYDPADDDGSAAGMYGGAL